MTFFDTSDVYGCGHSERMLGQVLAHRRARCGDRHQVRQRLRRADAAGDGQPGRSRGYSSAGVRGQFAPAAATRLIDLYQLHNGNLELGPVDAVVETLERLVDEGKIRWYGWSTDDPERAAAFAKGDHCAAIQQRFNLFEGNAETLAVCEADESRQHCPQSAGDGNVDREVLPQIRNCPPTMCGDDWNLAEGEQAQRLEKLGAVREVLTAGGRTLAQGALGWLWARSEAMIPIPGFKTVAQVEENAGALEHGPLSADQMAEMQDLMTG